MRTATQEIADLFNNLGTQNYYGEAVTQLQHALQAAKAATDAGSDDQAIVAALLHDIGHMLGGPNLSEIGVPDHDQAAMKWLRERGFPEKTILLVGAHVGAKRYLVSTNPDYMARLSPTSVETLKLQGGPMSEAEVLEFQASPLLREMLRMRVWDENAKDPNAVVPALETYFPMIDRLLA